MDAKCPFCGGKFEIKNPISQKGGEKSRRKLSPEQARKMVEIREAKRKIKSKQS